VWTVSDLEAQLLAHLRAVGLPEPAREYRFHPVRRWRFDYAYPAEMLGIECEGGTWKGGKGRHTSGRGFAGDCEKYSEAAILGWRVLRFTREQIESGYAVSAIERALGKEGTGRHG
jgi:very-short-patch-repair endonuclease